MIVLYCTMLHRTLSLHHFYFTIKVMLPYLSSCIQFQVPHLILRQIHSTLHLPSLTCASWTHHFSWWAGRFMSDVAPSLSMNRQEHRAWQVTYRDCGKHWFTYVDIETALFASLSSDADYHASWLGHQWNTISLYLPELEWTWFWTTQFCWFQDTFNMLVNLQVSPPFCVLIYLDRTRTSDCLLRFPFWLPTTSARFKH